MQWRKKVGRMLSNIKDLNDETKKNMKQYYSNAIINAVDKLEKKDRVNYVKEILKRQILSNIIAKNLKQKIKKIYIKIKLKEYNQN